MTKFEDIERADLKEEIKEIKSVLSNSYENMQLVSDEGMIDYYSYLIKAYEAKYGHLLKKFKKILE